MPEFERTPSSAASGPRLRLHTGGDERLPTVQQGDHIARLDVRSRVFEEAEVVAGCVVEAAEALSGRSTG